MTASKYITIIKQKYPDLYIRNYKFNNNGQNNDIIVINDELIFRFPKYKQGIEDLRVETEVLLEIQNCTTIAIPNPQYKCFGDLTVGEGFIGYFMIPGEPLFQNIFLQTRDKHILANQLGIFLKELHNISITNLSANIPIINPIEYWQKIFDDCKDKLFPYMKLESKNEIQKNFSSFLSDAKSYQYNPVIIHGDFGPSNILFDNSLQRISGIIDFSSVRIGDPALDFASLIGPFGYGENFLMMISDVYPEVGSMIERARFYASTFSIQEALFGVINDDEEAFINGISQYR